MTIATRASLAEEMGTVATDDSQCTRVLSGERRLKMMLSHEVEITQLAQLPAAASIRKRVQSGGQDSLLSVDKFCRC